MKNNKEIKALDCWAAQYDGATRPLGEAPLAAELRRVADGDIFPEHNQSAAAFLNRLHCVVHENFSGSCSTKVGPVEYDGYSRGYYVTVADSYHCRGYSGDAPEWAEDIILNSRQNVQLDVGGTVADFLDRIAAAAKAIERIHSLVAAAIKIGDTVDLAAAASDRLGGE